MKLTVLYFKPFALIQTAHTQRPAAAIRRGSCFICLSKARGSANPAAGPQGPRKASHCQAPSRTVAPLLTIASRPVAGVYSDSGVWPYHRGPLLVCARHVKQKAPFPSSIRIVTLV